MENLTKAKILSKKIISTVIFRKNNVLTNSSSGPSSGSAEPLSGR
jgi:hypothetical protein